MLVSKKTSVYFAIELSLREISFVVNFARANDAKIVRSRDAQCTLRNHLNGISGITHLLKLRDDNDGISSSYFFLKNENTFFVFD